MNIVEVPKDSSIEEAIESFSKNKESFEGVMLLALRKDGSQLLETSKMNAHQKAFLCQFINAYMSNWFDLKRAEE